MVKKDNYRSDLINCVVYYAEQNDMQLIIQTAGGTIIGKPILEDEEVNPLYDEMIKVFGNLREKKIEELQKETDDDLYTKAVFLKEASIDGKRTTNVPFLFVFVDEISAISLGNTN